jgi:Sulfocyanin (SoxE) domain
VSTANAGNEIASCRQVSSDSHQSTIRGGRGAGFMSLRPLLLGALLLVAVACDPITGTGSGTPPDPNKYLKVDSQTRTAVVTLIAGFPASDYQFNYDGYTDGQLVLKVPLGWTMTIQCANRSTVNQSCAVVSDAHASEPLQPDWRASFSRRRAPARIASPPSSPAARRAACGSTWRWSAAAAPARTSRADGW